MASRRRSRARSAAPGSCWRPRRPTRSAGPSSRKALAGRDLVDFDGLVELPAALLGGEPALAEALRERWPLISVDEYQDIDASQYALLRLLSGDGTGLTVIGDPDQAIYGFRGADVGFFLRFGADYPGATTAHLTRNYRSAPVIVTGALQAIAPSTLVPGRVLRAAALMPGRARGGRGASAGAPAITVHEAGDEQGEAAWIAAAIDRLLGGSSFHSLDTGRADGHAAHGLGLADIAVLYRTDAQAGPLGQALTRAGLPFQKRSHDLLQRRAAVPEIVHEMCLASPAGEAGHGGAVADRLAAAVRRLAGRSGSRPGGRRGRPGGGRGADSACPPLRGRPGTVPDRDRARRRSRRPRPTGRRDHPADAARRQGTGVQRGVPGRMRARPAAAMAARGPARAPPTAEARPKTTAEARPTAKAWTAAGARPTARARPTAEGQADGEGSADGEGANGGPARPGPDPAEERRLLFVGMTRARTHLFLTSAAKRRRHGAVIATGPSPFLAAISPTLLSRTSPARPRRPADRQLRLL